MENKLFEYFFSSNYLGSCYSLHDVCFLREDPENELSFVMRLEGGRHDAVGAGGQLEATGYLPHVDEGWRPSHGRVVLEEVQVKWTRQRVWVAQLSK